MHKMMHEKHKRLEEVKADTATLQKVDDTINTHIMPCLVGVTSLAMKAGQLQPLLSQ